MTELFWAAKRGDLTTIDAELAAGATLFDVERQHYQHKGWDAIVYGASSRACIPVVFAELVARTREVGALEPRRAATALHEAAKIGAPEKVRALLEADADPCVPTLSGGDVLDTVAYFQSPQHLACLGLLLAATGERRATNGMGTAQIARFVFKALRHGCRDAAEALGRHGGAKLLGSLSQGLGVIGAKLVLGRGLELPAVLTAEDATQALVTAAKLDDVGAVQTLVARGADLDVLDALGAPLLNCAAGANAAAVVRWLLERGADPNALGEAPWPPLQSAVANGAASTTRALLEAGASLEYLLDDQSRSSVIPDATGGAIAVLYESGADLNTIDGDRWLLGRSATVGDVELAHRLLSYGVDVNIHHKHIRRSALHKSVENEEAAVALLLLARGADANLEDIDGKRPLDLARSRFLRDALIEHGAEGG